MSSLVTKEGRKPSSAVEEKDVEISLWGKKWSILLKFLLHFWHIFSSCDSCVLNASSSDIQIGILWENMYICKLMVSYLQIFKCITTFDWWFNKFGHLEQENDPSMRWYFFHFSQGTHLLVTWSQHRLFEWLTTSYICTFIFVIIHFAINQNEKTLSKKITIN